MATEIIVPKLGLTMKEATLVKWGCNAGERLEKEEIVLVLETDKVTFEMPAPAAGLLHPMLEPGSTMEVGQLVAYLANDAAELADLQAKQPAAAAGSAEQEAAPAAAKEAAAPAAPAQAGPQGRIKASPVAKAMAKKHGLDLASIPGSGPGGRIIREDVVKALEKGVPEKAPAEKPAAPKAPPVPEEGALLSVSEQLPVSGVRKVVFNNMHMSLATQAQLTLHTEASAKKMIELRNYMNQQAADGTKISFNAIIIKAVAQAVKAHPRVNASVEDNVIKVWKQIHVGVAMDLGEGLIVPKVRFVESKSVREISREIDGLVEKARNKALLPDDLQVGTFTVTNLGAWDIDDFTPIVNNPESAILGVGRIVDKPVAVDGQVVVEPRLALSLTIDHRIIDGAPGAAFLKTIKNMLEQPLLML